MKLISVLARNSAENADTWSWSSLFGSNDAIITYMKDKEPKL